MYRINLIVIILVSNVFKSLQVLPTSDSQPSTSSNTSTSSSIITLNDLKKHVEQINNMKDDIISSINMQEKSIITLTKLLQGPGKDFDDANVIREDVNERIRSSSKLAKTILSIIDSINPYMSEKIEQIIKCKNEAKSPDDEKLCMSSINDVYSTSVNNFNFLEKRISFIKNNGEYMQNLLNELMLRLQNKSNPHTRAEIIGAYVNNFKTASESVKMYMKLSDDKKNSIFIESEKISDMKTTCMRSLKAVKRFNRAECVGFLTKIAHEYMFMKHTEDDIYKLIDDVMHVLSEADNVINGMIEKFEGTEEITVDDIMSSLDNVNEIIENVIFTYSDEGTLYKAIGVYRVSSEKIRRLVEKANNFVDHLLITRNVDVFRSFKKPFHELTIKSIIDSIELVENRRVDLVNKLNSLKNLVETEDLTFRALEVLTRDEYKPKSFHKKIFELGRIIKKESNDIIDGVNASMMVQKYTQILFYMNKCLDYHGNRDNIQLIINEKIKASMDCREGFKMMWNVNDKKIKNKIEVAMALMEEKLKAQKQLLKISVLSRDYNEVGRSMDVVLNEVSTNYPEFLGLLSSINDQGMSNFFNQ